MVLNEDNTRQKNVGILTYLQSFKQMVIFLKPWLYEIILLSCIDLIFSHIKQIFNHAAGFFFRLKKCNTLHPLDTGRKLNVQMMLGRHPGRLLNVLCTFHRLLIQLVREF